MQSSGSIFKSPIFQKVNNFFTNSANKSKKSSPNRTGDASQIQADVQVHSVSTPVESPISHYTTLPDEKTLVNQTKHHYDATPHSTISETDLSLIEHLFPLTVYEVCSRPEYIKYLPLDNSLNESQKHKRNIVIKHFLSLTNDVQENSLPALYRTKPSPFLPRYGNTDFEFVPFGDFLEEFFTLRELNKRNEISVENAIKSIVVNIGVRNLRTPSDFFQAVGLKTIEGTQDLEQSEDDFSSTVESTDFGLESNQSSSGNRKTSLSEELIEGRARLRPVAKSPCKEEVSRIYVNETVISKNQSHLTTTEPDFSRVKKTNPNNPDCTEKRDTKPQKGSSTIEINKSKAVDDLVEADQSIQLAPKQVPVAETPSLPQRERTPPTPRKVTFSEEKMDQTPTLSFQNKLSSTPYAKKTFDEVYKEYFEDMINNGIGFKTACECAKKAALKHTGEQGKQAPPSVIKPNETVAPKPKQFQIPMKPSRPTFSSMPNTSNVSEIELETLATQKQLHLTTLAGQIPIFNPSVSSIRFETWLKHFESVMALANIDEEQKIAFLCSRLLDTALETAENVKVMCQGEEHYPLTYIKVREGLMKHFHGNETRYHFQSELKHSKQKPSESFRDFACRLRRIANLAYPCSDKTSAGKGDGAKFKEDQLITSFIDGIPPVVASWTRRKRYATLDEAVAAAEINAEANRYNSAAAADFINGVGYIDKSERQRSPARPITPSVPEYKDILQEITKAVNESVRNTVREEVNKTFRNSGKAVQFSSETKQPPRIQNRQYCEFHRYYTNHSTEECWTKKNQAHSTCHACKEVGHIAPYCPNRRDGENPPPRGNPQRSEN